MVYISALCYFFLMCENIKIGHLSSYQISIQMKANINPSPTETGLAPGISESEGVSISTLVPLNMIFRSSIRILISFPFSISFSQITNVFSLVGWMCMDGNYNKPNSKKKWTKYNFTVDKLGLSTVIFTKR